MLDTFSSNVHNSSFSAKLLIDIVKAEHDEEQEREQSIRGREPREVVVIIAHRLS